MINKKQYQHIFFDLDNTLWDFEKNSLQSLQVLFEKFNLQAKLNASFTQFHKTYIIFNQHLWKQYRRDKITKEYLKIERFYRTLKHFKVLDYDLAGNLSEEYLTISGGQKELMPNVLEILQYLKPKYQLHIITNGFEEIQHQKLTQSNLLPFFNVVITSESAKCKKPDPRIFFKALKETQATKEACIMVGDNTLTDIKGAMEFGIDQVYFNPQQRPTKLKPTFQISDLLELKKIL